MALAFAILLTVAGGATTYFTTRNQTSSIRPCGTSQTFFSVLPISPNDTVFLTPLGSMSPPDHVFPAPHLYMYVLDPNHPIDRHVLLHAPGDMVLTSLGIRHYNTLGKATNFSDYTLTFYVCDKLLLYFHHVTTLTYQPFVEAASKILPTCSFSAVRNEDYCQGEVSISITAGTVIGTVGDVKAGSNGLDVGARDFRLTGGLNVFADPARDCNSILDRCYASCPFDYYPQAIQSQLMFEGFDGTIRTTPPTCGTVNLDVKGTGQGYWYGAPSTNVNASPEANDLYLGPDNVNTRLSIISLGTAIPGTQPGKYAFEPSGSGNINRNFSQVSPDGTTYCYETNKLNGPGYEMAPNKTVFLVRLLGTTSLEVQVYPSTTCGSGAWNLDSSVTFSR